MASKNKAPATNTEKPSVAPPNPLALLDTLDQAEMAKNLLKILPLWQEALSLMAKLNSRDGHIGDKPLDPFGLRHVMSALLTDMTQNPQYYMELQKEFWSEWMKTYTHSMQKLVDGIPVAPEEPVTDRRFKNPLWSEHPFFDFLRQSYGILSKTLIKAVHDSETLPPRVRAKVEFFVRQLVDALSPTNNPLTNPEVLDEMAKTNGENIVRGLNHLLADLKEAQSAWMVSSTPKNVFKVGVDMATTEGAVVFRNEMMELIQYSPSTEDVHKTPILVIPPWINKYYILDLRPDNSYVKWMVDQGHTVFLISWKNPDSSMRDVTFFNYMQDGVLSAIKHIQKACGVESVNAIGYCIGGTLLAMTLAWLKAKKQDALVSKATFLTTLIDFREAGDLLIFTDEEQIANLEAMMAEKGYLDGEIMKATFAMLRANDMIWSYVVNNYWMGRDPQAFDMLAWNSDVTNLPASFHSDYLRSMYSENRLATGNYKLGNTAIKIETIDTPSYFLSAKDDHIAPWKATYNGMRLFSGPHVFTLSGSGHVAGVVNPPAKKKYGYWTSEKAPANTEDWLSSAAHNEGSWWTHWQKWVSKGDPMVPARKPTKKLADAPGPYVVGESVTPGTRFRVHRRSIMDPDIR